MRSYALADSSSPSSRRSAAIQSAADTARSRTDGATRDGAEILFLPCDSSECIDTSRIVGIKLTRFFSWTLFPVALCKT
jgi:hypothetical protein